MKLAKDFDISTFSATELFLNENGKTSSTKFMGLISGLVCVVLFVGLVLWYMFNMAEASTVIELIDRVITVYGISCALMGVKSISSSIGSRTVNISNGAVDATDNSEDELIS